MKKRYFRVEGIITKNVEEYVEAETSGDAINQAQDIVGNFIDDASADEITEQEYENNK